MTALRRRWLALALLFVAACTPIAWELRSAIENHDQDHSWKQPDSGSNHYQGMTPDEVLAPLGPPTHQWAGHFGLEFDIEEVNPESWVYYRNTDDLYLSFSDRNGRRECFVSASVPKGTVF